jgi:uncharacterized protein (DUF342 family)
MATKKRPAALVAAITNAVQAEKVATDLGITDKCVTSEQPTKDSNHLLTYTEQFIACKEKLAIAEGLITKKEQFVKQLQMVIEDYKADLKLAQETLVKNQEQIKQLTEWLDDAKAKLAMPLPPQTVVKAMDQMGQPRTLIRSRSV